MRADLTTLGTATAKGPLPDVAVTSRLVLLEGRTASVETRTDATELRLQQGKGELVVSQATISQLHE